MPALFLASWKRDGGSVALTAIVGDDGIIRSIALRGPGEAVDVAFDALDEPQGITAP